MNKKIYYRFWPVLFLIFLLGINSCKDDDDKGLQPPPVISGVEPSTAMAGTTVTITGDNFSPKEGSNAVTFNDVPAEIVSTTKNKIIAIVPEEATTGVLSVIVDGKVVNSAIFTIIIPPPTISSVSPTSAPEFETITITGTNFSTIADSNIIMFNNVPAVVNSSSRTEIVTSVPQGATSGPIKITVSGQTVIGPQFTVKPPAPFITDITPMAGDEGTIITITGANFSTIIDSVGVTFNGVKATVTSATTTEIKTTVPKNATTGPIAVTVNGQTYTGFEFTVTTKILTITNISPTTGKEGTVVTIIGDNFSMKKDENIVNFNGIQAIVTSAKEKEIVTKVPVGATTGLVKVTVGAETAIGPEFIVDATAPSISSITPTIGVATTAVTPGTTVTITGVNFSTVAAENIVTFNGTQARVTNATATKIVVTVPAGATTGPIKVEVKTKSVTGPIFTVIHTITGINPKSGVPGTVVTITGSNFSTVAAENIVTFNDKPATQITIVNASQIKAAVPAGATTGQVKVKINGQTVTGPVFTVIHTITGVTPPNGLPGTKVTITGTGFSLLAAENIVTFNDRTATVTSATATQIIVTVPDSATTGPVAVQIGDNNVEGPDFIIEEVVATITSVTPLTGPVGTIVTITGTNFDINSFNTGTSYVLFNGEQADEIISVNATEIKIKVPQRATTGPVSINAEGKNINSNKTFIVTVPPPTIININPTRGQVGDTITINGNNFGNIIGNIRIYFSTNKQASVITATPTQLTTIVPAGAVTGSIRVEVGGKPATSPAPFTVETTQAASKTVYWSEVANAVIYEGKLDAQGKIITKAPLLDQNDGLSAPVGVAVDKVNNKIYWTDQNTSEIWRANLTDGSNRELLFDNPENGVIYPIDIVVGGGKIYWTDGFNYQVVRGNSNGSGAVEVLYEDPTNPPSLAGVDLEIAGNTLYWTQPGEHKVMKLKLDGASTPKIVFDGSKGLDTPYSVAVDVGGGKIYIADNTETSATATDKIYVGNLDGSSTLTSLFGTGNVINNAVSISLDLVDKKIYWLNQDDSNGSIMRGNLDGSGNSVVVPKVVSGGDVDIE